MTHSPPIVPPICPEPITPMRSLVPPVAWARARQGRSAAAKANVPLATSSRRRQRSMGSDLGIDSSSDSDSRIAPSGCFNTAGAYHG